MSELDKLIRKDPEFLPLEDWRVDNDSGDEIKNRKEYANYVRSQYVDAGMWGNEIASEINQFTYEGAVADGVLKEDDEEKKAALLAPEKVDLDSKLQMVQSNLDFDTPAWQDATKYLNFKKVNPEGVDVPEEIRLQGEQFLADAQAVAETDYNTALRNAVRSGELPLAKVKDSDGKEEIIVSPTFGEMSAGEAIRASKRGGVSFEDATAVQSKLSTPVGFTEPLYKIERYTQAASAIAEYIEQAEITRGPLFRPRQGPRSSTELANRHLVGTSMYRILMSYLERLPGAMKTVETEEGTYRHCIYSPHSLRACDQVARPRCRAWLRP